MKTITLIGCLLIAILGISCVLTAVSLTNNTTTNTVTQSLNDQQQNTTLDPVITKTAEVSKNIINNINPHKKEDKTVKNNKKINSTTTTNAKHNNSNNTNKNSKQSNTKHNNKFNQQCNC